MQMDDCGSGCRETVILMKCQRSRYRILNLTPGKCPGWLTPFQAFFKENGKDIIDSFA